MTTALKGVLPVAPTVFHDDESLDLDGQRRVTEFLIDSGAAAVCVLANYSEQFSLTDAERLQVLEATVRQAAGRVPVIATTSAYSARIAVSACGSQTAMSWSVVRQPFSRQRRRAVATRATA